MVKQSELVDFLKAQKISSGFLDQLKVNYRPLICRSIWALINIGSASSVFDIGCGSGQFALLIAAFSDVKRLGGIEIDQRLIDNARKLLAPYSHKSFRRTLITISMDRHSRSPHLVASRCYSLWMCSIHTQYFVGFSTRWRYSEENRFV